MYYELYIDVFFCVNLSMDLLVLYIMKQWMKLPGSMLRLIAASAYGAGIITCYLLFPFRGRPGIQALFWILAGAGMIQIAFAPSDNKNRVKLFLVFYMVNLFLTGVANRFFSAERGAYRLLFCIACMFLIIKAGAYLFRWLGKNEKTIYSVHIVYQGSTIELKGLWDTGNCLVSPYHQKGVSVIGYDSIKSYIQEGTKQRLLLYLGEADFAESGKEEALQEGDSVFAVSYRTVGEKSGIMPVMSVDRLIIQRQGTSVEYAGALLGIVKGKVSTSDEYQVILTTKG